MGISHTLTIGDTNISLERVNKKTITNDEETECKQTCQPILKIQSHDLGASLEQVHEQLFSLPF